MQRKNFRVKISPGGVLSEEIPFPRGADFKAAGRALVCGSLWHLLLDAFCPGAANTLDVRNSILHPYNFSVK